MNKQSGFIKQIVIMVVLALIVAFGYFATQAFWENKSDLVNVGVKGFIDKTVEDTKQSAEDAKNQAIQDVKQSAADALKNKIDDALGTSGN